MARELTLLDNTIIAILCCVMPFMAFLNIVSMIQTINFEGHNQFTDLQLLGITYNGLFCIFLAVGTFIIIKAIIKRALEGREK